MVWKWKCNRQAIPQQWVELQIIKSQAQTRFSHGLSGPVEWCGQCCQDSAGEDLCTLLCAVRITDCPNGLCMFNLHSYSSVYPQCIVDYSSIYDLSTHLFLGECIWFVKSTNEQLNKSYVQAGGSKMQKEERGNTRLVPASLETWSLFCSKHTVSTVS